MKILIVSDTHGRHYNLETVLEKEKPLDLLIHLGDVEGNEDYIELIAECPVEIVAGNNDYYSDLPGEREIRIGKYRELLTHGHYYYVNSGTERIKREALIRGLDIVMFGHTHKPIIEQEENIIILNPGSISYPRQEGRKASYIVMNMDKEGKAHFLLEFLQ